MLPDTTALMLILCSFSNIWKSFFKLKRIIRCWQWKGECASVWVVWVCVRLRRRRTLRVLEVKGSSTSGGMSKPGGHGKEKLLSRNWPLIASSTSLSINTTTTNQSSATVRAKRHSFCVDALTAGHFSHLCLFKTSWKDISEPYSVSFQCFRVPIEYDASPETKINK